VYSIVIVVLCGWLACWHSRWLTQWRITWLSYCPLDEADGWYCVANLSDPIWLTILFGHWRIVWPVFSAGQINDIIQLHCHSDCVRGRLIDSSICSILYSLSDGLLCGWYRGLFGSIVIVGPIYHYYLYHCVFTLIIVIFNVVCGNDCVCQWLWGCPHSLTSGDIIVSWLLCVCVKLEMCGYHLSVLWPVIYQWPVSAVSIVCVINVCVIQYQWPVTDSCVSISCVANGLNLFELLTMTGW